MNRRPELTRDGLAAAAWPANHVAEAMQALARRAGLPLSATEAISVPDDLPVEQMGGWIEKMAEHVGVQVDQAFVTLDELDVMLTTAAPVLVRLSAIEGAPFLAVLGRRGRFVHVLGNDFRVHRLDARAVAATIKRPF